MYIIYSGGSDLKKMLMIKVFVSFKKELLDIVTTDRDRKFIDFTV